MSKRSVLSDNALIESCINHYKYKPKYEKIVFVEDFGRRPADLPKAIKVHKKVLDGSYEYMQNIEDEKWMSMTEKRALR